MARVSKTRAARRKTNYGRFFMALAVVAGGAALWAGVGSRASRPPARQIVAARTVAPAAPTSLAAAAAAPVAPPPKPAQPATASAPQQAPAQAPQQAPPPAPQPVQAPIVVPLPRVQTVEAAAEAMSTELAAALDAWLISSYKRCWKAKTAPPDSEPYFPKIRVAFKTDGALAAPPRLVNPPSDPAWKPQADAALRAVKACDPLHVPDKYAPYYRQWKTKTVYFDPARS
jgi:hypothetical protein